MLSVKQSVVVGSLCLYLATSVSCSSKKDIWERQRINVNYKAYNYGAITGEKPIELNSAEGMKMLTQTPYNKPFFALAQHFSGQEYPTTCGPASARIVLSAIYEKEGRSFLLDAEKSLVKEKNGIDKPRYMMTESNIFNPYKQQGGKLKYNVVARQEKNDDGVYSGGIDLQDLTDVIRSHQSVDAKYVVFSGDDASKAGLQYFRELLKNVLISNDVYLIANYHLSAMYDRNSGHYSPIVAYYEDGDYVLVMDVASHLGVWVWVKLEDLYRLMNGTLSGIQRGYIVAKRASADFDLNEVKNYDDGILDLAQKQIDEQESSNYRGNDNTVASGTTNRDDGNNSSIIDSCKSDVDGKCGIEDSSVIFENKVSDVSSENNKTKKVVKLRKVKVKGTKPLKKVKITNIKSSNNGK